MSRVAVIGNTARIDGTVVTPKGLRKGVRIATVPAAGVLGVLLGVDPWNCGPSLADMDLEGSPDAVKRRVLG